MIYAVVLLALFSATGLTPKHHGRGHDGIYYAAMAADELRAERFYPVAPYCYRVLTPLIVSLLPGPVASRFAWFNLFTWFAVLLAWHSLARRTGLSRSLTLFGGVILATCAWGPVFAFYCPCYIDPLMYLLVLVGLNLMLAGRTVWLAVLLPLAVLQREQCLILWACALVHASSRSPRAPKSPRVCSGGSTYYLLTLLPCIAVYAALRLLITPVGTAASDPLHVAFAVLAWLISDPDYLIKSMLGILYALGLPLVGVIMLPAARQFVRDHRWAACYLLLAGLCIFGGSDKARLVFLAMPVLLIAFLHGLSVIFRRIESHQPRRAFALLLAALLLLHLYGQLPPHLMIADGLIQAPLVDSMERGTHGATPLDPGHAPAAMSTVAHHVLLMFALASAVLMALRLVGTRDQSITANRGRTCPACEAG